MSRLVETFQKQRDTMKASEVAKEEAKAHRAESPKILEEKKLESGKKAEVEKKAEEKKEAKAEEKKEAKEAKKAEPTEKPVEKQVEKQREAKKEKPQEIVEERLFAVPLNKAFRKVQPRRAAYAARLLKAFVARHAKVSVESISILPELNNLLSAGRNPPKKLRVKISKYKEGKTTVEVA